MSYFPEPYSYSKGKIKVELVGLTMQQNLI